MTTVLIRAVVVQSAIQEAIAIHESAMKAYRAQVGDDDDEDDERGPWRDSGDSAPVAHLNTALRALELVLEHAHRLPSVGQ
jgi:hypothetical protein